MILDEDMTQNLRKELKELTEKNLEGRIDWSWISEKNKEMQNSTSKEDGELIALQDTRRKDTWTPATKSGWTLERMN